MIGPLRIYIAAPFEAGESAKQLAAELEADGHTITHRWWLYEGALETLQPDVGSAMALADLTGVRVADAVVVMVPVVGGCGMWVEVGYAMARGTPIYEIPLTALGNPPLRNIFSLLNVRGTVDSLRSLLMTRAALRDDLHFPTQEVAKLGSPVTSDRLKTQ